MSGSRVPNATQASSVPPQLRLYTNLESKKVVEKRHFQKPRPLTPSSRERRTPGAFPPEPLGRRSAHAGPQRLQIPSGSAVRPNLASAPPRAQAPPPVHAPPPAAPSRRVSPEELPGGRGRRKPSKRFGGGSRMGDSKVKVAVRVRPMNRREIDLHTKCVVDVDANKVILNPVNTNLSKGEARAQPKVFAYDHCFWSMDESVREKYAGQDDVFKCLGENILQNAFDGYNACIFAYGQTGSGKSYTMMGTADQPGLIPRLCSSLFERTQKEENEEQSFKVEVSYMEIYNEKVRDLLDPKGSRQTLKVREHSVLGPYVDGLSKLAVTGYKDIESLMSEGNKSRTVAATNMNEESSRSHAVFKITLTHTLYDVKSGTSGEKVGKLSLVDLAGSERATKTGAAGDRLKEGSNINKSLTTLGLVISALADQSAGKNKNKFVPYRDSVLTWLLKDSLGGNSKTAMVATVSPAADNYDETLSTLRYADRAKHIVNHAVVNEDPNARIIRDLREEVEKLREQLTKAEAMKSPELKDRLEESEKLIQEMTVTWEEKLRKTEEIAQERQKQLESLGISLQSSGIKVGDDKCFLVNLNADPALNELLVYYLKEHTLIGSANSQDIQLCGMGILPEHCIIDITPEGQVMLTPQKNTRLDSILSYFGEFLV